MEEVSSTANLETEILESARKKAVKALKDGEAKREALKAELKASTEAQLGELETSAEARIAKFGADLESRFPLEKSRLDLLRKEEVLEGELDRVLPTLGKSAILEILKAKLMRAAPFFKGDSLDVRCEGLEESEAKAVIGEVFPEVKSFSVKVDGPGPGLEISLASNDGSVMFRCSLSSMRENLLRDHRGTLVDALFKTRSTS